MSDAQDTKPRPLAAVVRRLRTWAEPAMVVVTLGALAAGGLAWLAAATVAADLWWAAATVVAVVPALWWVLVTLRKGRAGVDLIAVLALVGTLAVQEYLAGALIAVMLATGHALDSAAERRASRDLRALLGHAPRSARRQVGDVVTVVALSEVAVGDLLVVAPGEVVPTDGVIQDSVAVLDESVLTGEPLHVERPAGDPVRSGVVNAGSAFHLRATATVADSTYASIVRLAQQASAENAPVVRLADRYAAWFMPLSLVIAGLAWLVSGSAIRAVAVLVVATPCPLLLAAPVAIVSGLSRASRLGVIIRGGGALETLGRARTLVLDKTGTLTTGRPTVVEVTAAADRQAEEVLRLAASADQVSPHVLAEAITNHARAQGLYLSLPQNVVEEPGRGVTATVDGRRVAVGKLAQPPTEAGWAATVLGRARLDSAAVAWVTVDGQVVGAVLLRDPLRRDAPRTLRRLRTAGLHRLIMLTGDRAEPAREIGTVLGLDEVRAEQTPVDKVNSVREEHDREVTVMVGDGVNDAPALAAADVGVAMGARGATASSEAADIVLTTDRLDRLADAMDIARRARRIAVQSAGAGMALSLLAMAAATLGWLPPALGALLQEAIDVAVILNALRALRTHPAGGVTLAPDTKQMLHRFAAEHDDLRGTLPRLRDAANRLAAGPTPQTLAELHDVHDLLAQRLLPHERAEETQLYPALAGPLGSAEATATMSRTHAEIERLAHRLSDHLDLADTTGRISPDQVEDLLSCLYGLFTVLSLHFVQEEENYFVLAGEVGDREE